MELDKCSHQWVLHELLEWRKDIQLRDSKLDELLELWRPKSASTAVPRERCSGTRFQKLVVGEEPEQSHGADDCQKCVTNEQYRPKSAPTAVPRERCSGTRCQKLVVREEPEQSHGADDCQKCVTNEQHKQDT